MKCLRLGSPQGRMAHTGWVYPGPAPRGRSTAAGCASVVVRSRACPEDWPTEMCPSTAEDHSDYYYYYYYYYTMNFFVVIGNQWIKDPNKMFMHFCYIAYNLKFTNSSVYEHVLKLRNNIPMILHFTDTVAVGGSCVGFYANNTENIF